MDVELIKDIKNRIELMNKHHQIEVLRILKSDGTVVFNENVNGVFVNLSEVSNELIDKLKTYIFYVDKQTINIEKIETQKEIIENTFFKNKGNKEMSNIKLTTRESYA